MKGLSSWKIGVLGLQHVLAMYAGAVVVPLIVGPAMGMTAHQLAYLISIDLFTCGIASLIQVIGGRHLGIKLPVILGCTFTAVTPMIAIGKIEGITAIYGAIIASGIVVMIIAQFFGKIMKWFPPIVTGSVVMTIGVSLIPVAMNNVAGGQGSPSFGDWKNLLLAAITFISVILINRFFNGYIQAISVLISLIIGTAVAAFMGLVDFKTVADADWFRVVQPLYFGMPEFHISAIITMSLVAIVSMIESTGVFLALGEVCDRKLESQDLKRGLRAEGLAVVIGGLFNAFPYTTFSQNVGLLTLSKVKTRNVVIAAGFILIVLGCLPKVAAITTIIPTPVLGGAMIPMFGMVIASGVRMLSKVDFRRNENLLIVACSVGIGLGTAVVPGIFKTVPDAVKLLVENGIVLGSFTAVFLNWLLNHKRAWIGSSHNRMDQTGEKAAEAVL
ncbi:nucleobase:cation symporter-2 family protein [Paenactinomyces guangxiensis]|uniref:Purine permease n=1 Tax=Paenactinomyces guangxiensis TaxID=1490290 RepID=A0A7W1WNG2_9BACL|nr:nucleobase:cation symporter-2 family protein [Paenactinomyces guangxiensis]MBA4493065.1 purine permease [Paenactinomyces guangxiensis]MBH8590086.1 purine permease [Paenactinomyces guangxiensis]